MDIFQTLINQAISRGVSTEAIILFLLLPLVGTFVSAARYLVGIRGLGIFTPVMLAAVFWATGLKPSLYLFLIMMVIVTLARLVLRKVRLHYLARIAILFWFLCLVVLVALLKTEVSLLSLLTLVMITQDFIKVQIGKTLRIAIRLSFETFILSLGGMGLLSLGWLQRLALAQPGVVILGTIILNFFIGRFTGLRLLEYRRFRRLLK